MRARLSSIDAASDPNAIWNGFVHFLACSAPEELDDFQRPAQLAFWYESEVQNGGHLQFFLNQPAESIDSTVSALRQMGAQGHAEVLQRALDLWRRLDKSHPQNLDECVSTALGEEFGDLDRTFYKLQPPLIDYLEELLATHQDHFVSLEESVGDRDGDSARFDDAVPSGCNQIIGTPLPQKP